MNAHRTENPSVLVVGTGYLGSTLLDRLVTTGCPAVGITLSDARLRELSKRHLPVSTVDVGDIDALRGWAESLQKHPETVVYCASSNRGGPEAYEKVFWRGTKNTHAVFPESHIVLTSSSSVYAQTDGSRVDETSPAEPTNKTGGILRKGEDFVLQTSGTVLRVTGIYGPGRCYAVKKLLDGTATIDGDNEGRYLNQIHRDDLVSSIELIISQHGTNVNGEIFNVADNFPQTQAAFYDWLAPRLNLPIPANNPPDPHRKRGWTNKRVSNAKLRGLGWSPVYPDLQSALPKSIEACRAFCEG